jgi:hypothetical protein
MLPGKSIHRGEKYIKENPWTLINSKKWSERSEENWEFFDTSTNICALWIWTSQYQSDVDLLTLNPNVLSP